MALEKRPQAAVRDITTAPSVGGKPAGLGYDPATGEDVRGATYKSTATRESSAEYDVFELVDERGYRPDRFYTRSVNADGHGERLQIRVPQGIDSQLYAAVGEIGQYRSLQDLFRDAVIHRLEWLQRHYSLTDDMRRMLELERMEADSDRAVAEVQMMKASVAGLNAALEEHYTASDWQMFADELVRGDERAEWLREPYRAQALAVLGEWRTRGAAGLAARQRERDRED